MQMQRKFLVVSAALALVFSVNSCAWMSNTMSRAKERIAAMRDRLTAKKEAQAAAEAAAPAQTQVAAANGTGSSGGHGGHVIAGTGNPIANGLGECVNAGFDAGSGHGGGCGGEAVAAAEPAAEPTAAPVVEGTPAPAQPVAQATPVAPAPAPQATAQPSEELFPPATEPQAAAAPSPAQQQAATTAAPTAPAVVEQPMPKPPAPAEQISLSADALFPFAKYSEAAMLPAGKAKLKELAERIKHAGPGAISRVTITGHADRLGRPDRKQLISERRAQTVKTYLSKLGVDSNLMAAMGKSDSDPVVSCKGTKATSKLKNCLAPNRRVDVAFFGDKDKIAAAR